MRNYMDVSMLAWGVPDWVKIGFRYGDHYALTHAQHDAGGIEATLFFSACFR